MKIVTCQNHSLHSPKHELILGKFVPYAETPDRITHILEALNKTAQFPFELIPMTDYGYEYINKIHTKDYIVYLQNAYSNWIENGGAEEGVIPDTFPIGRFHNPSFAGYSTFPGNYCFDGTGVIVAGTYQAAYEAAQVALTGAHLLLKENSSVLSLCRPPGHHAHSNLCGGYCFFNNAAIAVQYLKSKGRVSILDVDYHHGNGTQDLFYEESNPLYVSLHGSPDFPFFWGFENEKGKNQGLGYNVNVCLSLGTEDEEYLSALDTVFKDHIDPYNPDFLVVSLGFDTFYKDPIGHFNLTSDCYRRMGSLLKQSGYKILFILEGGYALDELGSNLVQLLNSFFN